MTLESNADNLASLSEVYTFIVQHESFPIAERRTCENEARTFSSRITELVYDLKMQMRRAKVLTKIMADRKAMVCTQESPSNT